MNSPPSLTSKQKTKNYFETLTIDEIRKLEYKTRSEIEEKKLELHQLIGNRYRDIIDSADSILDMKRDAEGLRLKLENISETCGNLRLVVANAELSEKNSERQLKRKLYFFAKQIKLLVDTPEEIWYSLEIHDYLRATIQYLIAKKMHDKLHKDTDTHAVKILRSISLVNRQWERIEQFPKKILEASQIRLEVPGLKPKEYGGALIAHVFLSNRKPTQVFMDFLSARKASLLHILSREDHNDPQKINSATCQFLRVLQYTLYHIGSLFLYYPFMERKLDEAGYDGEFETGTEKSPGDVGLFYILLSKVTKQLNEDGEELGPEYIQIREETIQNLTSSWLSSCTELVTSSGILSRINSAKQIFRLEELIFSQNKYPFLDVTNTDEFSQQRATTNLPSWAETCLQVLNKPFDIWENIFRVPLLDHVKRIISAAFRNLSLDSPLEQVLDGIHRGDVRQNEECVGEYVWSELDWLGAAEVDRRKQMALCIPDRLHRLVDELDRQIGLIMEDVYPLLGGEGRRKDQPPSATKKLDVKELRKFVQDTCFSACINFLKKMEEIIDEKSGKIQGSQISDPRAPEICEVLFIGRLCTAICVHSKQIKNVLVNLDPMSSEIFSRNLSQKTRQIIEKISIPYKEIEQEITNTNTNDRRLAQHARIPHLKAYLCWTRVLLGLKNSPPGNHPPGDHPLGVHPLGDHPLKEGDPPLGHPPVVYEPENTKSRLMLQFYHGLKHSDWGDPSRKKCWMPIKMQSDPSSNGQAEHSEYIPAHPSHYLTNFLYQLCDEIQLMGGHIIDDAIIHYILREISLAVISAFSSFIISTEESILKESILQFWFDVKFFLEVVQGWNISDPVLLEILGEKPETKEGGLSESLPSLLVWTKKVEQLMKDIKSKLDRIDILFYEKPIAIHTHKFYAQCHLLFGQITKSNPSITERQSVTSGFSPNMMTLLPAVPRFKLLPILEPNDSQTMAEQPIEFGTEYSSHGKTIPDSSSSQVGSALRSSLWGTLGGFWGPEKVTEEKETSRKSSWFG